MVDAWLIIATIIIGVIMLAVNLYLFLLYSHPDDNKTCLGWFGRVMILLGSIVVWGFILVLPLDVANSRGLGGGMNIEAFYQIIFIIMFALVVVVLPLTLWIYESDDEMPFISRLCTAICYEIGTLIIVTALALIAWGALKVADIADADYKDISGFQTSESILKMANSTLLTNRVTFNLPSYLFIVVFLIFIGWFLLVIFAGIGITALPMDLILDYIYRPRPRPVKEIAERKVALRRRVEELMIFTKTVEDKEEETEENKGFFAKWKSKRALNKKENKLEAEVFKVEQEFEIFQLEQSLKANPVVAILKLILGIFFSILSFIIWLHVILYRLANKVSFLNDFMLWLEFKVARFISTIFFAGFCIYILFCALKGNLKFGLRFLFFIKIHPMKTGQTYINTFIFNVILMLITVPAIIHFQVELFQIYMQLTSSAFLFTSLVRKMRFFKIFYENKVFYYAFIAWSVITLIYLFCKPKSDRLNLQKIIQDRKKT